jgi:energy-converting hydrogenase Eha subunit H
MSIGLAAIPCIESPSYLIRLFGGNCRLGSAALLITSTGALDIVELKRAFEGRE